MPNIYEIAARNKKVSAILGVIAQVQQKMPVNADEVEQNINNEETWQVLAQFARVKIPSMETRRAVIDAMRDGTQPSAHEWPELEDPCR